MFTCSGATDSSGIFQTCNQGPSKLKKIGEYLYNYDNLIGNGTYSQVYEGFNLLNDKPVAIKVIDLQMVKQRNL